MKNRLIVSAMAALLLGLQGCSDPLPPEVNDENCAYTKGGLDGLMKQFKFKSEEDARAFASKCLRRVDKITPTR